MAQPQRIGLVLGGGGEVGIAWETGVLAALEAHTRFRAADCTVIAGTSAGSVVGALAARGNHFADLYAAEQHGGLTVSPIPIDTAATDTASPDAGTAVVPLELMALLMATEGTITERAAAIGKAAVSAPTAIDQAQMVNAFAQIVGGSSWPTIAYRASAVRASTGETVLWDSSDPLDFATAVASSCAVPGFFPAIKVEDDYYVDGPRTPLSRRLVEEYQLDAMLFVGLDLPILSNSTETDELEQLAASGTRTLSFTGSAAVSEVAGELMDPRLRPRAAAIGYDDGEAGSSELQSLFGE